MTFRAPLTDEQIARTLERHGYDPDEPVLGIRYTLDETTVNVEGALLIVPEDVLQMEHAGAARRPPLFDHGAE